MSEVPASVEEALGLLERALESEARALARNDAEGLLEANRSKLAALEVLERQPLPESVHGRLRRLMERNRANGVLLARRRREVHWALRHLGRSQPASGYERDGSLPGTAALRSLGVG
ncbi:MAG: hypothetical protein KatS3mg126_2040 [Lysobacteraceae bacterium]|nr:MAG: hypothetical protein KatS3mg126_2040 [Xanthomonadaceae bacterium]